MGHHHDEAEDEQVPFSLAGASGTDHHIVVTRAKRKWLAEHLERQWRRPPTADELDRLVADFVREEVLYREALSLGLDRDDLVVRRRLVQKMEMLALQGGPGVSDSDLMDHFLAHRADFVLPESVSFRHVFFSAAVRGGDARAAAQVALAEVRGQALSETTRLGDPPPTPREVADWTRTMVEDRFGTDFARAVFEVEPGAWSGPISSAHGYHLVLVSRRQGARVPDFAEVADRVATDLETARRSGALDRVYAAMRPAYDVEIEPAADDVPSHPPHMHSHDDLHSHEERTRA